MLHWGQLITEDMQRCSGPGGEPSPVGGTALFSGLGWVTSWLF